MTMLGLNDLGQYSDTLHVRSGQRLTLRFVEPRDADALQGYVRGLSQSSRYRRFLGAASELPPSLLDGFTRAGADDRFSVIATIAMEGDERIVAEARYALDADQRTVEFGLSVDDRWQGHGIGAALLKNLECRAAALGAERLFGDALRFNDVMIALARKAGFALTQSPGDWRLVRFEKQITAEPRDIPCASWRIAAASIAQQAAV
jgi:RimJ/RimL family protein N-acetyltransferase